jgi:hypothetical protein
MGHHRIVIDMVGGHGCDRDAKEGQPRTFCERETCPDCAARSLVEKFEKQGCFSFRESGAKLIHWPGEHEIIDDLLAKTREKGTFGR